jgi:hypothetical protein
MTRARRTAAIALCAGLALGLAGQLTGRLDLLRVGGGVPEVTNAAQAGRAALIQAASSMALENEQNARMTAADALLSARAAAVRTRNKSAWMATVDLPGSAFRGSQSVAFDNLMKLPLGEFSYGTVGLAPALAPVRAQQVGPGAWAATVTGTYSLAGFDRAPRSFEATYTLVQRPGGWRIAADTDGATAMQLWDLPGLRVLRGRSVMVIGNAPEARMRDYCEIAQAAVRRVSGVWGTDWNTHVVIVTPSTTEEFANLLLRSPDGLDQVAAITEGTIDPGQRAQGDRVVVNPKAFTVLPPIGRQVVITHELTHVAARSSTTEPVSTWLSEGMAEYVGYSGVDLPRAQVASELLTLVRAGKGPVTLPTAADFNPAVSQIATSYNASWLAVNRLVDLYGQSRVVAFYRAIAGGPAVNHSGQFDLDAIAAQAFPRSFGVTEALFVRGWRGYLQSLARTRG